MYLVPSSLSCQTNKCNEYSLEPGFMKRFHSKQWIQIVIYSYVCLLTFVITSASPASGGQIKGAPDMSVSEGRQVSIEYILKLEDKTVVDSNVGGAPLTYVHGSHQIVHGLEKSLAGMKVGDKKEVTVNPEDGYGPVDTKALIKVNKEQVPPGFFRIGYHLQGRDNNGN